MPAYNVMCCGSRLVNQERGEKMQSRHGGDVYRNQVQIDFSVNTNPLGIPTEVEDALHQAVKESARYPDMEAGRLRKAVSGMAEIPEEWLLFGNGASELFMAIIHGLQPKKTVIPVPSFYGYEYAAGAGLGEIIFYETEAEKEFALDEDFFSILTEEVELLILANPNNPNGAVLEEAYLQRLLQHCKEKKIYVVLDECFAELCWKDCSVLYYGEWEHVLAVRAFTKLFAIPGVRLGYLICSNKELLKRIARQLPEWNLSCFSQAAGCACAGLREYRQVTKVYINQERAVLEAELKRIGFRVFPGVANFILFYSRLPLYEMLLERKILIRDCANFRGLSHGFYRIAVKSREENKVLLRELEEIVGAQNGGRIAKSGD